MDQVNYFSADLLASYPPDYLINELYLVLQVWINSWFAKLVVITKGNYLLAKDVFKSMFDYARDLSYNAMCGWCVNG